ncbi:hypothetical protein C8J56DRAFT_1062976 [Mycena floridula]|nr:hypothetical protein C8J56DRAFT_1062976 [Mycena floridula]
MYGMQPGSEDDNKLLEEVECLGMILQGKAESNIQYPAENFETQTEWKELKAEWQLHEKHRATTKAGTDKCKKEKLEKRHEVLNRTATTSEEEEMKVAVEVTALQSQIDTITERQRRHRKKHNQKLAATAKILDQVDVAANRNETMVL